MYQIIVHDQKIFLACRHLEHVLDHYEGTVPLELEEIVEGLLLGLLLRGLAQAVEDVTGLEEDAFDVEEIRVVFVKTV